MWRTILIVFFGLFITFCRGAEVVKSEIQGQSFIADFYCRQDSTNKLGVLFLGGSEGGKPRGYFARFLATNGYPTLALAYFKEKGLPESLQSIPLEYFDQAIAWMETNQQAHADRVVVVGASRGAELALLLASTNPKIKGVVALSPSSVVWNGMPKELPIVPCSSWTLGGKPVPFMPYDSTKAAPKDMHDVYLLFQEALKQRKAVEKAAIKVERIHGPVLLASGQDDEIWPAGEMADAICSRLKEKGFKYRFENLKYPDAGHTLNERLMIGGTFEGNQKARIDFEEQALVFLKAVKKTH
jgi:dienelactone hydrolase